jgi:hypothetical protein
VFKFDDNNCAYFKFSFNNLFRFGVKFPAWSYGASQFTTVILTDNTVSGGVIQVQDISFLFLSGNQFDYTTEVNSVFTCSNDATLSSEINLGS